jgi:hypothetical protein
MNPCVRLLLALLLLLRPPLLLLLGVPSIVLRLKVVCVCVCVCVCGVCVALISDCATDIMLHCSHRNPARPHHTRCVHHHGDVCCALASQYETLDSH